MIDLSPDTSLMEGYPDLFTVTQASGVTNNVPGRALPINVEMADPTGICRRSSTTFRLAPGLLTTPPVIGETITTADATVWTIVDGSVLTFNGGYFLECVSLDINPETCDVVNILTPVFSTDAWADVVNVPTPTIQNVPCAIVPVASGVGGVPTPTPRSSASYGSKKGMTRFYAIYLLVDVDLPYGAVIRNVDNTDPLVYLVEGQTGRISLKDFSIIHTKVLP